MWEFGSFSGFLLKETEKHEENSLFIEKLVFDDTSNFTFFS